MCLVSRGAKNRMATGPVERALKEIRYGLGKQDKQGTVLPAAGRYLFCHEEISGSICQLRSSKPLAVSFCRFFLCPLPRAKELIEGVLQRREAIALMDSAVAKYDPPYGKEAAPYLYERARMKAEGQTVPRSSGRLQFGSTTP